MIRRFLILLALLAFMPAAQAQSFPKLTGRVVDDAALLSPAQEQGLTGKLAALETQSGRQLVVATIPDLQGYDIADYGYRLGRAWGIGEKAKNDGALLIVAPNERKIRVEVGYGLEGLLTDAQSAALSSATDMGRDVRAEFTFDPAQEEAWRKCFDEQGCHLTMSDGSR